MVETDSKQGQVAISQYCLNIYMCIEYEIQILDGRNKRSNPLGLLTLKNSFIEFDPTLPLQVVLFLKIDRVV